MNMDLRNRCKVSQCIICYCVPVARLLFLVLVLLNCFHWSIIVQLKNKQLLSKCLPQ